jgi:formate hydrogenlyase subunit 6/NADH:ubiquinone oxidoreductase subunit I
MAYMKIGNMVMRSLGRKPATLMYPVIPRDFYDRTRGRIEINIDECIFCGMCSRKCPPGALSVSKEDKRWAIERMSCIQCCCCVEVCPKKCLANEAAYTEPDMHKITDSYVQT